MPKTFELRLEKSVFENFINTDYVITQNKEYSINDFILLTEYEVIQQSEESEPFNRDTGLYRMTQIKEVIKQDGLKDGYVLLILNKL